MRDMMILTCVLMALLASVAASAYAEATPRASLGIFDATADWGLEPGFPPQRGEFKVPGRVEVTETEDGLVYDIYGNGDDIYETNDEGFFVNTEREGSWSLSARLEWIDRGNDDPSEPWPKLGLMIRESGDKTNSKTFYALLRAGLGPELGDILNIMVREFDNSFGWSSTDTYPPRNVSMPEPGPVYLRVTRIAPLDLIYSEWSLDGETWDTQFMHRIVMDDAVAYGLAITNHGDDELLAHGRVSHVEFAPLTDPPIIVERILPRRFFETDRPFEVELKAHNLSGEIKSASIVESTPEGWTVVEAGHDGLITADAIEWELFLPPGEHTIRYTMLASAESSDIVLLDGSVNGKYILGVNNFSRLLREMKGEVSRTWRYWRASDGLETYPQRWLYVSGNGTVITAKGEDEYARLDGYSLETIPFNEGMKNKLSLLRGGLFWGGAQIPIENAFGQIWAISYADREIGASPAIALQKYENEEWITYPIPEVFPTTQPVTLMPGGKDEVFIQLPDRIMRYDALARTTELARDTTNFLDYPAQRTINSQGADGSYWVFERGQLVQLIAPTPWNERLYSTWKEYPYDDSLAIKNLFGPRGNANTGITAADYIESHSIVFYHFDGELWRDLYSNPGYSVALIDTDRTIWETQSTLRYLKRIEPSGKEAMVRDDLLSGITTDIAADPYSGIWAASQQGVAKISPALWSAPPEVARLDQAIHSIDEDEAGSVWFLAEDRLMVLESEGEWNIYTYPGSDEHLVQTIRIGLLSSPFVDFGTIGTPWHRRLIRFFPHEKRFETGGWHGESLVYLYVDQHRGIQWSTYELPDVNRSRIIRKTETEEKVLLEFDSNHGLPRVLGKEDNGDFWLSLFNQLRLYKGAEYRSYGLEEGYRITECKSMLDLGNGIKWFAGGNDLVEFDGNMFTVYRSGFIDIHQMMQDSNGAVWIASRNGLWKYSDGIWLQFEVDEGLPSNVVYSVFEDSQRRIWTGTIFGLALYHPDADWDHPIAIIHEHDNINHFAAGSEVRIVFTGIDRWKYTESHRLLYSTRLNDEEWSPFTTDTIFAADELPPGDHVLSVRAMDRNGNIDPTPASWQFTVLLPWYREPMFLLMSTVGSTLTLIFAGLALLHYTRLRTSNRALLTSNEQLNYANLQLNEANEKLLELDKMKTAFVSQASHDLRTPLTAIKGSLDNLAVGIAGELNEKQHRILDRAVRSVDRLGDLVNDVLDLARIESGRITLETSEAPFKTLVESVIHAEQPAAAQKNIQLNLNAVSDDLRLHMDVGKIERVVSELVSNAIKYTPEGGKVEVGLATQNGAVELRVADTGIGMSMEDCTKIWERFYRTRESQSFAKGSGLGLSIAKELVEMHGGTLTVESEKGRGTMFTMRLPISSSGNDK